MEEWLDPRTITVTSLLLGIVGLWLRGVLMRTKDCKDQLVEKDVQIGKAEQRAEFWQAYGLDMASKVDRAIGTGEKAKELARAVLERENGS